MFQFAINLYIALGAQIDDLEGDFIRFRGKGSFMKEKPTYGGIVPRGFLLAFVESFLDSDNFVTGFHILFVKLILNTLDVSMHHS